MLVSVHGQTDTASLQDSKNHLEILDTYAGLGELKQEYQKSYAKLEAIRKEIKDVGEKISESERMKEILEYQIKDIASAGLHSGEEEELVEKKVKIKRVFYVTGLKLL